MVHCIFKTAIEAVWNIWNSVQPWQECDLPVIICSLTQVEVEKNVKAPKRQYLIQDKPTWVWSGRKILLSYEQRCLPELSRRTITYFTSQTWNTTCSVCGCKCSVKHVVMCQNSSPTTTAESECDWKPSRQETIQVMKQIYLLRPQK